MINEHLLLKVLTGIGEVHPVEFHLATRIRQVGSRVILTTLPPSETTTCFNLASRPTSAK